MAALGRTETSRIRPSASTTPEQTQSALPLLGALCVALPLLVGCGEQASESATAAEPAQPPAVAEAPQVPASYSDDWGPAVGTKLPLLDATDHTGTQRALADLSGEEGLLLIVSRSADW